MRSATAAEAEEFAREMARRHNARITTKDHAIEWQIVTGAIRAATLGAVDVDELLEHYSTSIGPLIYLENGLSPDAVIEVVTHECEHVHQFWEGGLGFAWLYLTEPEARVAYEARAYAAGLEVRVARGGAIPPLDDLAMPLEGGAYMLSDAQQAFGRRLLEVRATQVAGGIVTSHAARTAIGVMRARMPHLLASSR